MRNGLWVYELTKEEELAIRVRYFYRLDSIRTWFKWRSALEDDLNALLAGIKKLRCQVQDLDYGRDVWMRRALDAEAQNGRLKELVRSLMWEDNPEGLRSWCRDCGQNDYEGHSSTCDIWKELK